MRRGTVVIPVNRMAEGEEEEEEEGGLYLLL